MTKRKKIKTSAVGSMDDEWHIVIPLVSRCMTMLGVRTHINSEYSRKAQRAALARIKEGYTESDLAIVVRQAASQIAGGSKFHPLRNLSYLWGNNFIAMLATATNAKVEVGGKQVEPKMGGNRQGAKAYRSSEKWQDKLASRFARAQED